MTCAAFSIKFAKTNQKVAENFAICENYSLLFKIIQNYSLVSLGRGADVPLRGELTRPGRQRGRVPDDLRIRFRARHALRRYGCARGMHKRLF